MGQYFKPICLDTKEYLHNHKFDGGIKFLELVVGTEGAMSALVLLCADFTSGSKFAGKWANKRVIITGDYDDNKDCPPEFIPKKSLYDDDSEQSCLYMIAENHYTDVSHHVKKYLNKQYKLLDKIEDKNINIYFVNHEKREFINAHDMNCFNLKTVLNDSCRFSLFMGLLIGRIYNKHGRWFYDPVVLTQTVPPTDYTNVFEFVIDDFIKDAPYFHKSIHFFNVYSDFPAVQAYLKNKDLESILK